MGRHLVAAVRDAGSLVAGHLWLIFAAAVARGTGLHHRGRSRAVR